MALISAIEDVPEYTVFHFVPAFVLRMIAPKLLPEYPATTHVVGVDHAAATKSTEVMLGYNCCFQP